MKYLQEYGDKSFHEVPFSEVDALVLSNLSYLKMDTIVPGFEDSAGVSWEQMMQNPKAEQMFSDPLYGKQHRRMFQLIRKSRRYGRIRAKYFMEWFDEEKETQFAAVTFCLGPTSFFLSYRGTDETLVGWKEDFNMGYMKTVPSQREALAYLKGVARYTLAQGSQQAEMRLILGGHSKGGNLAVYAASWAPKAVQQRIRRVYSFDGPGFQKKFYETIGFRRIEDRFCKIVPEQSLVGMLLANYRRYRVVRSYGTGVMQHDLTQWKIRDGRFVYRSEMKKRSSRRYSVLNAWIESLSESQIVLFVDTLYELLRSAKVRTVADLVKAPLRLLAVVRRNFRRLDHLRRRDLLQIIRKLFEAMMSI